MKKATEKAKVKQPLPKKEAAVTAEKIEEPLPKVSKVKKGTDLAPVAKTDTEASSTVKEVKVKKKSKEKGKEKVNQPLPKKAVPTPSEVSEKPLPKESKAKEGTEVASITNIDVEASLKVDKKKGKKKDKKKAADVNKEKTLCKYVKKEFLKTNLSEYKSFIENPQWVCKKCGRVSNNEKLLCKPELI